MLKLKLHWQILIAMILAVVFGYVTGTEASIGGVTFYSMYGFVGGLFLSALKMLIVPLIMASIITGVAGIGTGKGFGRLGSKTVIYYFITSLLAILTGLFFVNLIVPGVVDGVPAGSLMGLEADVSDIVENAQGRGAGDFVTVFERMLPANIIKAAADGQMLGIITFSLLFAYYMVRIPAKYGSVMTNFWQAMMLIMLEITELVMKFSPIGVFALVAKVVASTGYDAVLPLASFAGTVFLALLFHSVITLPLLLAFIGRVNPLRHYQAMTPALLMAFSTSSSAATLPVTLDSVEKRAGVSNKVSSFVLPLGATINMDGTALYECVAVIFIAQAYGIDLSMGLQFLIVTTALLTSIGVAGVPAASLVAIVVILAAAGLPAEGVGLILAVDRILDMSRTAVNVFSDSSGAVIIARTEGEVDILKDASIKSPVAV
ncbi:MAG: glutamate/aspartate:proton symporter GltP [Gammaproteobacteria bacterium]|nr:MAG: glutamate/aspartate:proton symporter GltP [Gammaproteobacteria bacterium]